MRKSALFLTVLFCISIFSGNVFAATGSKSAPTEKLSVSAKAAILMEASTGKVLYAKNSDTKLPIASTTKIMTALLSLESGNLDEPFVVDSEAIKVEGSSMGLKEGDIVTKRVLCCGMLLPSGNDAANATAIKIAGSFEAFAKLMNERAKKIGMHRTYFVTPSGLDAKGHASTAYDMALLTREAMRNQDFRSICSQQQIKVSFGNPPYERWLTNTNRLLYKYKYAIGVKTGFTDEAGRCLVSCAAKNGAELICITFNAPDDWNDHIKLYENGFPKVTPTEVNSPENLRIDVVGGVKDNINIFAKPFTVGMLDKDTSHIKTKLIIPSFVYAPVKEGDVIGSVEFYYDSRYIGSADVLATENVEQNIQEKPKKLLDKISDFLKLRK